MLETYGLKIDIESLENVCRTAGGYPENSSYATAIYYEPGTGKVWSAEFADLENEWIEGKYPVLYCTSGHVSPQEVIDRIKERK